jgi:hypothetical protein
MVIKNGWSDNECSLIDYFSTERRFISNVIVIT